MDYAVVKIGGKQYKVALGDVIDVDRIADLKPKDKIEFSDVLLLVSGKDVILGKPLVSKAKALGTVIEHVKGEKIRVAKFKAKVRYRRVMGHRQKLTRIKIDGIKKS